jgi:hypothetical protein
MLVSFLPSSQICDDCCKGQAFSGNLTLAYDLIKEYDPYHITAGAFECGELNWSQEPWLSLDMPMDENYRPDLKYHATTAAMTAKGEAVRSTGTQDSSLRMPPMTFEPVMNMPGPQRAYSSVDLKTLIWLGVITADMTALSHFVYSQDVHKRWEAKDAINEVQAQIQELLPSLNADVTVAQPTVTSPKSTETLSVRAGVYREKLLTHALDEADEEEASSADGVCVHLIVANVLRTPAQFTVSLHGLSGTEIRLAQRTGFTPMFDGSCTANDMNFAGRETLGGVPAYLCRNVSVDVSSDEQAAAAASVVSMQDWLGPSATTVYRLGCGRQSQISPRNESSGLSKQLQVIDNPGFETVQEPGVPGCRVWMAGCYDLWETGDAIVPAVPGAVASWADDRAWLSVSTILPHSGRHCGRVQLPTADRVYVNPPLDSAKTGQGFNQCLANDTSYDLELWVRGSSQSVLAERAATSGGMPLDFSVHLGAWTAQLPSHANETAAPRFEVAKVLATVTLTTTWQKVSVALPAAEYPCRKSWGGPAEHYLTVLAFAMGGEVGSVWLDDVTLVANRTVN